MSIVCWWAYRKIGGAVRHHYRPHKWIGRGAGQHVGHHAGAAKVIKILVCVAVGGGIGGASSWEGGSSSVSAALPPAPSYSEIPGLGSGWFGPSGPALIGGSPELLTPPFETMQAAGPMASSASVAEFPEAIGGGSPLASGTIPGHLPGTIENRIPVSEPVSTLELVLIAAASLLFLRLSGYPR